MSKEVLAIDFDEVVRPLADPFLVEYNAEHGTNFTTADFKTYRWEHALGLSVEETVEVVYAYHSRGELDVDPFDHAQEGNERLKSRFEVDILTARNVQFEAQPMEWLGLKMPDTFRGVHMIDYDVLQTVPG